MFESIFTKCAVKPLPLGMGLAAVLHIGLWMLEVI